MTDRKIPGATDEEDAASTAAYHEGADNSIKNVTREVRKETERRGGELSGIDDEDIQEVKDPGDGKTAAEATRQHENVRGRSIVPEATKKEES